MNKLLTGSESGSRTFLNGPCTFHSPRGPAPHRASSKQLTTPMTTLSPPESPFQSFLPPAVRGRF